MEIKISIYIGPGNRGVCKCKTEEGMMMYNEDHQCYKQFTQVNVFILNQMHKNNLY